jgi:glycosyltransferase involved in cell wall biosynthesis
MRKRKIEVISDNFYPVVGGGSFDILTIHSKLAEGDWDIRVHTTKNTYTEKNSLKEIDSINNISVRRYANRFYGYFPDIDWKGIDYIVLNNFNVFPHFYIFVWTWILRLIGQKTYKIILTPYTGYTPIWTAFSKPVALVKRVYHETLGLYFVNSLVDGIRAISEWERALLIKAGVTTRIDIIKCGVEDEAFGDIESNSSIRVKDLVKNSTPYIVQIGRIHKLKNYEVSIRALSQVKDVRLVIVGPEQDMAYKKQLLSLISSLKLDGRVLFTGIVPIYDKFYLLKHSAIAIHTSLFEGFGIAVYEAMSQGCICLVSWNTAVDEMVKDGINGYSADPHDDQSFAMHINNILGNMNSVENAKIRQNNLAATKDGSWSAIVRAIEKFYLSLNKE